MDEVVPGHYQMMWRTRVLAGMRLPVVLQLPDQARDHAPPSMQELPDSVIERGAFDAGAGGLAGKRIEFAVLVRVQMLDGR